MDFEAAEQLFLACDKDKDGFISRQDLESLCYELQLEESVDDLMTQLGADAKGQISYAQFLLSHKNLQLTPSSGLYQDPQDAMASTPESFRRRDPKNASGRMRNARHWDWLGQALEVGFLKNSTEISKEQLLKERRQKMLQERLEPEPPQIPVVDNEASKAQILELSQRLAQVTAERDHLKESQETSEDQSSNQCQKYEERIVELHSVIAEMSRKLDNAKDVIVEESEVTDSCIEEESENDDLEHSDADEVNDDYDSLNFERDLEEHNRDVLYKIEMFDELQKEMTDTRAQNQKLEQVLVHRDHEIKESAKEIKMLQNDRESLKRQLEDLQSTLEYQEAKMDKSSRSSSERRSLRRKKSVKITSPEPQETSSSIDRNSLPTKETELKLAKALSQVDHLKSQNDVLQLTLDDAKTTSEKLSIQLARHESNSTAMQLTLAYADQAVEAYDVLVALLETEVALAHDPDDHVKAQDNRRSALSVARHLICRYDKTFPSDTHVGSWEADSSGCYTTSSTTSSTNSSAALDAGGLSPSLMHKSEEMRLREHICQLKTIRSTIQGTVLDLEPYQVHNNNEGTSSKKKSICAEDQLENAVIKQELMAAKEEMADLKAKIYVSDKEKRGLDLTLQEKRSVEIMLRTHIHHLQEQVNNSSHLQASKKDFSKTEDLLRQRIENLLSTLDKVIQTSEMRQKESGDLIQDLKKANSTLSEALDKTRRKYQSKIKKLEQQFIEENNK